MDYHRILRGSSLTFLLPQDLHNLNALFWYWRNIFQILKIFQLASHSECKTYICGKVPKSSSRIRKSSLRGAFLERKCISCSLLKQPEYFKKITYGQKRKIQMFVSHNIVYSPPLPFGAQQAHSYGSPSFWNAFKSYCSTQLYFARKDNSFMYSSFHLKINFKMEIYHRPCEAVQMSFPEKYCLFMVFLTPCKDAYSSWEDVG